MPITNKQALQKVVKLLDEVVSSLADDSATRCSNEDRSCLRTQAEKRGKYGKRSHPEYRESEMCEVCAAFWHAERARAILYMLPRIA